MDKKVSAFTRLSALLTRYQELANLIYPKEVHIELLPRTCHIYTHYSVGVIGLVFAARGSTVAGDIPVKSWQKAVEWEGARTPLAPYKDAVHSEDELAAIGMGLFYVNRA